jgi:hypothetical protein
MEGWMSANTHLDGIGIQRTKDTILRLAGQLQKARLSDPAMAVSIMSLIAENYRHAVETASEHHLIAMLPGNAALWKEMEKDGYVDENLYARLKTTVSRAIFGVFPDIARFAEGIDTSLMAASKMRREYDVLTSEIQFAVDTGKASRKEDAPLFGLRRALVTGGVNERRLAPIALEAIHDVVFSHLLTEEEQADFVEHSMEDVEASVELAETSFDLSGRLADISSVIQHNLFRFRSIQETMQAGMRYAA